MLESRAGWTEEAYDVMGLSDERGGLHEIGDGVGDCAGSRVGRGLCGAEVGSPCWKCAKRAGGQ